MEPPPPPRKPSPLSILLACLVLVVSVLLALVLYDAPPPDDSDFRIDYRDPPPNSENGISLLEHIQIPTPTFTDTELLPLFQNADSSALNDSLAKAKIILANNVYTFGAVARAIESEHWHINWIQNWITWIELSATLQDVQNLKRLAIFYTFHRNEHQLLILHLEENFVFARKLSQAGIVTTMHAPGVPILESTYRTIAQLVSLNPERDLLDEIRAQLIRHPPDPNAWNNAARYRYTFGAASTVENARRSSAEQLDPLSPLALKPNRTLQLLLKLYRESAANSRVSSYSRRDTTVARRLSLFPSSRLDCLNPNYFGNQVAADAATLTTQFESTYWRTRFLHTRSLLLIALQLHQLDHNNQLPPSLDDLVPTYLPKLPKDPYNGAPLHYDPNKRLIWSVGENLTNDNGHINPNEPHRIDWDNPTFQIPKPTAPPRQNPPKEVH